jgi:hypothetical protein
VNDLRQENIQTLNNLFKSYDVSEEEIHDLDYDQKVSIMLKSQLSALRREGKKI